MDVAVRSTLEVGLLAEDKVEQLVVEFVVEIDKDWRVSAGAKLREGGCSPHPFTVVHQSVQALTL